MARKCLAMQHFPLKEGSTWNISTNPTKLLSATPSQQHLKNQERDSQTPFLRSWTVWMHLAFKESTSYGFFTNFLFLHYILFFQWMGFLNQASRKCSLNTPERSRIGLTSQGESQMLSYTIPMSLTSQLLQSTIRKKN